VTDLGNLASGYGMSSGASWVSGDTNLDDKVDVSDLGNLASSYGSQLAAGSADVPTMLASASVATAVPEPSLLGAVGCAGVVFVARRRGRRCSG
jgi:hypothetical protein